MGGSDRQWVGVRHLDPFAEPAKGHGIHSTSKLIRLTLIFSADI
jgi:hypothetical protein